MRFRKRAKLFPGVYLNFSKTGISTTIGVPGASINFGKNGTYLNTGIPGTGLYDRTRIDTEGKNREIEYENTITSDIYNEREIKSNSAETITSKGLSELKKTLIDCYKEKNILRLEIAKAKTTYTFAKFIQIISFIFIFGFFIKWFKRNSELKKENLNDLKNQLSNCFINIDIQLDPQYEKSFIDIHDKFINLTTSHKIWDLTSTASVDQLRTRSAAGTSVDRKIVKFSIKNIDIIKSKYDALHFQNANGGDLYLYPAFLAIVEGKKKFGLIDIRELDFYFHAQRFVEEEKVPNDTDIIEYTWAKVNKNGERDKRFKENYQIPICKYGEMEFSSKTGLHEAYSLSNYNKANDFSKKLDKYLKLIKQ